MGALETLDHVVIAVTDLDRALDSYAALLGRSTSWRGIHPEQGTANALFQLDNAYVELLAPRGDGPLGDLVRDRLERNGEGLAALAFGTRDLGAFAETVSLAGIEVGEGGEGRGRDESGEAERRWRTAVLPLATTRGVLAFAIEHRSPPLPPAPLEVPPPAAVAAIDHVVVMSGDIDASVAVYRDTLGLRLALDRDFPERGLRLVFFRVGGVTVELAGSLNGEKPSAGGGDDLWGLAYRVADVDAARERLTKAGWDVTAARRGQKPGTRVCTVRDRTHGVATLLIGPDGER
jgi:catechol 2,3-dioxygenase-like lactoylglutathione lyase family enzyme